MKRRISVLVCAFCAFAAPSAADEELGAFMRRSSTFDRGMPMSASVCSVTTARNGAESVMDFNIYTARDDDSMDVMLAFSDGTRILTSVPAEGGKPVVRVKLRSFFAPVRVPFVSSAMPFFGTDFSAGDMNPRNASYDSYRRLGESAAPDGSRIVLVEAVPLRDKVYDRVVHHVDADKELIVRSEMYKDGRLAKVMEVLEVRLVDGLWSAVETRMSAAGGSTSTVMSFRDLRYGGDMSAFVGEHFLRTGRAES